MATVWLCRYGVPATSGTRLAERPFPDCVKLLRLRKAQHMGGVNATIQFGNPEDSLAAVHKGFAHVVVLVSEAEARKYVGWNAGYYPVPASPKDAAARLGVPLPRPPAPPPPPPSV